MAKTSFRLVYSPGSLLDSYTTRQSEKIFAFQTCDDDDDDDRGGDYVVLIVYDLFIYRCVLLMKNVLQLVGSGMPFEFLIKVHMLPEQGPKNTFGV